MNQRCARMVFFFCTRIRHTLFKPGMCTYGGFPATRSRHTLLRPGMCHTVYLYNMPCCIRHVSYRIERPKRPCDTSLVESDICVGLAGPRKDWTPTSAMLSQDLSYIQLCHTVTQQKEVPNLPLFKSSLFRTSLFTSHPFLNHP